MPKAYNTQISQVFYQALGILLRMFTSAITQNSLKPNGTSVYLIMQENTHRS